MSEKTLDKLVNQLSCAICLDTYTDPKILQCHHVFCQGCLGGITSQNQQGQTVVVCPKCRQVTPVPGNGVAGLQSAFRINQLLEIISEHKKSPYCPEHGDKEVELYCETCEELICWKCIMKNGAHHSHDYEELAVAVVRYREEMTASLELIEKQVETVTEALDDLTTRQSDISSQKKTIESAIQQSFMSLHKILDSRKAKLLDHLQAISEEKMGSLEVQREKLKDCLAQFNSFVDFIKEAVMFSNEEVVRVRTSIVEQATELADTLQPAADMLKLSTKADMTFSVDPANVVEALNIYGFVSAKDLPDPSKSYAIVDDKAEVMKKHTATLHIHAVNFNNQPCRPIETVSCELVSDITGSRTDFVTMKDVCEGKYNYSYCPTIKGRHELHIKVDNQHIRGSPFSIIAGLPKVQISSTPILSIDTLNRPRGVVINKKGEVAVVESRAYCVSIVGAGGKTVRSFGTQGAAPGEFRLPKGLAVDDKGNFFVIDHKKHSVQKFTAEGIFIAEVGSFKPPYFHYPSGVAVNSATNKIYVTDESDRIHILNSDLTPSGRFGTKGGDKGQFYNPQGMALDNTGSLYVADSGNSRIQVFTADGKFLRMFGRSGDGPGELGRPVAVAVDTRGVVYVGEATNNRVSVFTTEGKFLRLFGRWGTEPGQFTVVNSLAVSESGVLYVCDNSGRLQLF